MRQVFIAVGILGLVACGGSTGGSGSGSSGGSGGNGGGTTESSSNSNYQVGQANYQCPSPPAQLTGTVASGGSCSAASDCEPTCCTCSTGSGQWLAVLCSNGSCDSGGACAATQKSDLCQ